LVYENDLGEESEEENSKKRRRGRRGRYQEGVFRNGGRSRGWTEANAQNQKQKKPSPKDHCRLAGKGQRNSRLLDTKNFLKEDPEKEQAKKKTGTSGKNKDLPKSEYKRGVGGTAKEKPSKKLAIRTLVIGGSQRVTGTTTKEKESKGSAASHSENGGLCGGTNSSNRSSRRGHSKLNKKELT